MQQPPAEQVLVAPKPDANTTHQLQAQPMGQPQQFQAQPQQYQPHQFQPQAQPMYQPQPQYQPHPMPVQMAVAMPVAQPNYLQADGQVPLALSSLAYIRTHSNAVRLCGACSLAWAMCSACGSRQWCWV
jgi:hypothetical protein